MSITPEILEDLVFNTTKMAIWSEVIKNPGITAKELMKNLEIKKTKMYNNLKEMEASNILHVDVVVIKNSNLIEKHYTISKEFDDIRLGIDKKQPKTIRTRVYQLFKLALIMAHLYQEMRRLLKLSNKDFESSLKKETYLDQIRYTRILYYTAEEEKKLFEDFKEFVAKTTWHEPVDFSKSPEIRKVFYFGFLE